MDSSFVKNMAPSLCENSPWLAALLATIGALGVLRVVYQTLSVFLQTFVLPGTSLGRFGAKNGAWAVVTGATDGIGKEFAFQLAKAGFNIFLVSRNSESLSATASDVAKKHGVKTRTLSINFANADETTYSNLESHLKDVDIGVLVNNVGKSHDIPEYFINTPKDEMNDIVSVNINATLRVTYAVLPGMVQKKRGLVLNIGSFAGAVPSPMLATYSATKAFMATFTSALAEEVRKDNVIVEHLNTYFVVSKLSKIRRPSMMVPMPGPYVRAVLSKIGLACGADFSGRPGTSTPYWSHALLDYAVTLIGAPRLFISYTHGLHKSIRRRALNKRERLMKSQ